MIAWTISILCCKQILNIFFFSRDVNSYPFDPVFTFEIPEYRRQDRSSKSYC